MKPVQVRDQSEPVLERLKRRAGLPSRSPEGGLHHVLAEAARFGHGVRIVTLADLKTG